MKPRTVLVLVLLLVLLLFAALNLDTFTRPTTLNLIFSRVDAPLGLVLLGVIGLLSLVYLILVSRLEITGLLQERTYLKDLEKSRKLASNEEESRLTKLSEQVAELRKAVDASAQASRDVGALAQTALDWVERTKELEPKPRKDADAKRTDF